ncbi:hypothetical protein [Clostridium tagluense]|uniref:hypothetical protein n=1 Tax=Clostridium tagluense TaxID=360422 RepID=UPI001CF1B40E|nr:hypothetical protein [Clostridium tagluense]MCB2298611.1 hypothetical protein [Clostridium tagluense]
MADTSKLNKVTEYVLGKLSEKFGTELSKQKIKIGKSSLYREFTGVSKDKDIITFICHHSGKTKGGNVPSAKLDALFAKCYLMEKVQADKKFIYFTNRDFYEIFSKKSAGIIEGIELKIFDDLPREYKIILDQVLKNASEEMV